MRSLLARANSHIISLNGVRMINEFISNSLDIDNFDFYAPKALVLDFEDDESLSSFSNSIANISSIICIQENIKRDSLKACFSSLESSLIDLKINICLN